MRRVGRSAVFSVGGLTIWSSGYSGALPCVELLGRITRTGQSLRTKSLRRQYHWVSTFRAAHGSQEARDGVAQPGTWRNSIVGGVGMRSTAGTPKVPCIVQERSRFFTDLQQSLRDGCRFYVGGLQGLGHGRDRSALQSLLSDELKRLLGNAFVNIYVALPRRRHEDITFGFITFESALAAGAALAERGSPSPDRTDGVELLVRNATLVVAPASVVHEQEPGSSRHVTATRRDAAAFLQRNLDAVRGRLLCDPVIGSVASQAEFSMLNKQLTRAVHSGMPPDFGNEGARAQYVLDRLHCRVSAVCETLLSMDSVVSAFRSELLDSGRDEIHVASVGGGPGFDVVAVALVASFLGTGTRIRYTVLDSEVGWKDALSRLVSHLGDHLGDSETLARVDFKFCDMSLPLARPENRYFAAAVDSGVDLCIFSYVVHENEARLRTPGMPVEEGVAGVFPELFQSVSRARASESRSPPAGLLFLDTTPRLWPALVATAERHGLEAHLPDMLRGRTRPREPLLLLQGGLVSRTGEEDGVRRVRQQLARHERYLAASDRKRQGIQASILGG